jgi:thymidine kinase
VKSDKDNRYAVSAVVSHDGVRMPCVAVPSLAAFREHVGEEEYRQVGEAFVEPHLNSPSYISYMIT